jgi:hypothetical protein
MLKIYLPEMTIPSLMNTILREAREVAEGATEGAEAPGEEGTAL